MIRKLMVSHKQQQQRQLISNLEFNLINKQNLAIERTTQLKMWKKIVWKLMWDLANNSKQMK